MSLTIQGMEELFRKFDNVSAIRVLEPPMNRSVLRLQAAMQVYPAPPPHSTYRRTGSYGRRWTHAITRSNEGLTGRVGNNIRYAIYVGGARYQARVHQGRWGTDLDAVDKNRKAIEDDFQRSVERAIKAS